jgi:outer membrane protein
MTRSARFLILAIASIGAASAQLKIGVINSQKAVVDTAEIKKAQAAMEAKFKPRQDQLLKLQKDLQDIQAQLQSGKLNQLGEQELQAQGQRKQRELQRIQQDLQEDVERDRNDILTRCGTRMRDVVNKLSTEKGLDIVLDGATTIYFKPTFDLTAEATAAYDKAYPVK